MKYKQSKNHAINNKRWRKKHPEYLLAWQRRNKEKCRAYSKKWYYKNKLNKMKNKAQK